MVNTKARVSTVASAKVDGFTHISSHVAFRHAICSKSPFCVSWLPNRPNTERTFP